MGKTIEPGVGMFTFENSTGSMSIVRMYALNGSELCHSELADSFLGSGGTGLRGSSRPIPRKRRPLEAVAGAGRRVSQSFPPVG